MVIKQKLGRVETFDLDNRTVDKVPIEWFEANKRILHKQTVLGRQVVIHFLQQNPDLQEGDVLFEAADYLLVVEIMPCEAIVIEPGNMAQVAGVCYEIGNKHLPMFIFEQQLLIPFDAPFFNYLQAYGYIVKREERKLTHPLKTSVSPHGATGSNSIFNKIMKLAAAK